MAVILGISSYCIGFEDGCSCSVNGLAVFIPLIMDTAGVDRGNNFERCPLSVLNIRIGTAHRLSAELVVHIEVEPDVRGILIIIADMAVILGIGDYRIGFEGICDSTANRDPLLFCIRAALVLIGNFTISIPLVMDITIGSGGIDFHRNRLAGSNIEILFDRLGAELVVYIEVEPDVIAVAIVIKDEAAVLAVLIHRVRKQGL